MDNLPAFIAIAALLIITPGPDIALVTKNAVSRGRNQALLTAFGIIVGLVVWTAASVLGLAAVIATSVVAFNVIKLAGAAYLVYLGIRTLVALREPNHDQRRTARSRLPTGRLFRQGLVSNL